MRCFITDMRKSIVNIGFFGAILLIGLLCFMTEIGTVEEPATILQAIFSWTKEKKLSDINYAAYMIFRKGMSTYVCLFIPLIASFPFISSYCNERKSGLIRFTISRVGWFKYNASKFLSSVLSGGIACLLGYLLFGLILLLTFPAMSNYDLDPVYMQMVFSRGFGQDLIMQLISVFLFGIVSVIPAFLIAAVCRNQYVITCFPVMLVYIWSVVMSKIERFYIAKGDYAAFQFIDPYKPNSSLMLGSCDAKSAVFTRIIEVNLTYLIAAFIIFLIAMHLHRDKGW